MFDELTNNLKISLDGYFLNLKNNPFEILTVVLDFLCVAILIYMFFTLVKKSRAWQLLKGIVFLIVITTISGWLKLRILNFILTSIMTYGVIALLIIFQPELRRTLEQLGSNTKFLSKFFEFNTSARDKVKDDIYKVTVAVNELAKSKTGALIVFERDIKLTDIIETGLEINSEISPQLLIYLFLIHHFMMGQLLLVITRLLLLHVFCHFQMIKILQENLVLVIELVLVLVKILMQ